jgi:hypothetical protein
VEPIPKNVHRFLFSTTSRLVGQFDSELLRIDHAWQASPSARRYSEGLSENPHSRNYFVLSVAIDPPETKQIVMPDHGLLAELFCDVLCILYGKRFDMHGPTASHGAFRLPDLRSPDTTSPSAGFSRVSEVVSGLLSSLQPIDNFTIGPNNLRPRPDLAIPLHLAEAGRILALFLANDLPTSFINLLHTAARFYARSLRMNELDPEFSYIDLVSCGEVVASHFPYSDQDLYDGIALSDLAAIRVQVTDGEKVAKRMKGAMMQIKKKFTLAIRQLVQPSFFSVSESGHQLGRLTEERFEQRIKAAYDLRSKCVHTGIRFGHWVQPHGRDNEEVLVGSPVSENKDLQKVMKLAPTYVGLERIIRYCLLRFIHLHGVRIDDRLDGPGVFKPSPPSDIAPPPTDTPPQCGSNTEDSAC